MYSNYSKFSFKNRYVNRCFYKIYLNNYVKLILLYNNKNFFLINFIIKTIISCEITYFVTRITLLFYKFIFKFFIFIFNKIKIVTYNNVEFHKIIVRFLNILRNFNVR